MAELTEGMLAKVRSALESRDLSELSQQHDQIVVLQEALLGYLQQVGRAELNDAEADEHARLVAATGEIENMSAALSHELAPLAQSKRVSFVIEGDREDLPPVYGSRRLMHRALHECLHNAVEHARGGVVDSQPVAVRVGLAVMRAFRIPRSGEGPRSIPSLPTGRH